MRSFVILAAAAISSGCVREAPSAQLANAAASGTERCISASQISARRITGPRTLEFDVGRFTYRNDLPDVCPGLANRTSFGDLKSAPATASGPSNRSKPEPSERPLSPAAASAHLQG
jgi:hypothetical protein